MMAQNFHHEIKNRDLDLALTQVLIFFSEKNKGFKTDVNTSAMLSNLKQITDFKLSSKMLDLNSYISILDTDLKLTNKRDVLKVFDSSYAQFLENNMKTKNLNLE